MLQHRLRSAQALDRGNFRFIVDPRNEDVAASSVGTVKRGDFTTICNAFADDLQGSFADGVVGSDHIPSRAELQRHIAGASLFLYMGPGALLCHMAPTLVSTLNLETCQCVVLLDRAENEVSERRQNKIDTSILPSNVQLRDPWATAALLSLRGVNGVLLNQWTMDAARNHSAARLISNGGEMTSLLGGGTLGQVNMAYGAQLFVEWQRLVGEVEGQEGVVREIEARRQAGLVEEEERKRRRAEKVEEEANATEATEEQAEAQEEEDPPLEFPSEEKVEEERKKLSELVEKREETFTMMRGVEGSLALALYGLPSLSC
jgi:hypothetical protein